MKKINLKAALAGFVLLASPMLNAQTQKKLWSLPGDYVKFSTSPGALTTLPGAGGVTEYYTNTTTQPHNAMHDANGDLLFFIADEGTGNGSNYGVFDKDGHTIGYLTYGGIPITGGTEIAIIPVPDNCNKYYLVVSIVSGSTSGTVVHAKFGYVTLDMAAANTYYGSGFGSLSNSGSVTLLKQTTNFSHHGGISNFAVTPLRAAANGGDRILFATTANILYKFLVTNTGFSELTTSGYENTTGSTNSVDRSELEVIALSNGNYRLGFSGDNYVGVMDFLSDGTYDSNWQELNLGGSSGATKYVHGLEFSPNGRYLYFTHEQSPYIQYVDATTTLAATNPGLSNAGIFANGHIELGHDGKLYFASSGQLGTLVLSGSGTPSTWTSNAKTVSLDAPYLNDQIDGEIYFPTVPGITGNNYACNPNTETYTISSGYNASYTYFWTVTGGTPSSFTTTGTASSQPITWTANGGTISVQAAGFGCATASLTINPCCRKEITGYTTVYLNDKTETTANITYSSTSNAGSTIGAPFIYVINGTYNINVNAITFSGCQTYLATNAQVNVNANAYLKLQSGAVWQAGCGAMWEEIALLYSTSNLLVDNSTLQDAKCAINSYNGSAFTLQNNAKLNANYVGVRYQPFAGTHPGIIKNTTISCYSSGLPANALIAPYFGQRSLRGIDIRPTVNQVNVGDASSGQTNTFDNLQAGIYCARSGLTVYNSDFLNITGTGSAGRCIASHGNANSLSEWPLIVGGDNTNIYKKNTFTNSVTGVYASGNLDVSVLYNTFNNLTTAVSLNACKYSSNVLSVNSNTIDDCNTNIFGSDLGGSSDLEISLNNINSSTASILSEANSKGITITNPALSTSGMAPSFSILDNTIKRVSTGIEVTNFTAPNIRDNTITALSDLGSSTQSNGIYLVNCPTVNVESNLVTGTSASTWWQNGIRLEPGCTYAKVLYNGVEDIGRGLFFSGACGGTETAVNNMKNNMDGFLLNTSAVIGYQNGSSSSCRATENTWEGTTFTNHIYSYNSDGTYSEMNLLSSTHANWIADMKTTGTIISGVSTGGSYFAVPLSTCSTTSGYTGSHRSMSSSQAGYGLEIAKDAITYPVYDAASRWWAKYALYNNIRGNENLQDIEAGLQNFSDSVSFTNIGKVFSLNEAISDPTDTTYVVAGAALNDFVPENTIEQHLKNVYALTIQNRINGLSESELVALEELAALCPYEDGPAVFNARALLSGMTTKTYTNDCEVVLPNQEKRMESDLNGQGSSAFIFPNPANEKFILDLQAEISEKVEVFIYDLTGKQVLTSGWNAGTSPYEVQTSSLSQGLYMYQVKVNNHIISSGKLSIIH